MLADWAKARGKFVKVFPNEYRRALKEMAATRLKEAA
jgi:glutamate synthase (NADPH/NADH) large chain